VAHEIPPLDIHFIARASADLEFAGSNELVNIAATSRFL